jgi:hypothetical protein
MATQEISSIAYPKSSTVNYNGAFSPATHDYTSQFGLGIGGDPSAHAVLWTAGEIVAEVRATTDRDTGESDLAIRVKKGTIITVEEVDEL